MQTIFSILSALIGIYSLLIFIRIILSWFGNMASGRFLDLLNKITDPYLNWWRKNFKLQISLLDFSAVAAIVSLSLLQNIFYTLSVSQQMTIGFILAQVLVSVWRIVSFIIGFFIIIIILRVIAYITNRNTYSLFWGTVNNISQPIIYRINRLIYGNKIVNYMQGMIVSLLILFIIVFGGRFIIFIIINWLNELPV